MGGTNSEVSIWVWIVFKAVENSMKVHIYTEYIPPSSTVFCRAITSTHQVHTHFIKTYTILGQHARLSPRSPRRTLGVEATVEPLVAAFVISNTARDPC